MLKQAAGVLVLLAACNCGVWSGDDGLWNSVVSMSQDIGNVRDGSAGEDGGQRPTTQDQVRRSDSRTLKAGYNYKYPFLDPSLSWATRIDDLVSRLTLDEIVQQTMTFYTDPGTVGVPRLGIKPYPWITECLRGQVDTNGTAFPQALGLSSAFSPELMFNISTAVSNEVRAHWNDHVKKGIYKVMYGLTCYSPVVNIMRHPLWGRNQETYGEDPFLTGTLGQQFVRGLQGNHPRYRRTTATCKHFDAHGGPENIPIVRYDFDARVSKRDWWMTFLPQFKMCVEANVGGLMCSYNSLNGIPACANKELLGIARKTWGFTGYITGDAGAIANIVTHHHYLPNNMETAAAVIKAGCNMEISGNALNATTDAVKQGKLTEAEVRENVKPLFYVRMRHGEFDPPSMNPYSKIMPAVIQSTEHRTLAIRAAMMSFVLLKNDNNVLPLKMKISKLAVVGPMASNPDMLFGDYAAFVNPNFTKTPYQGLKSLAPVASLANGCTDPRCQDYNQTAIRTAVTGADLVVVCVGLGQVLESEMMDRADLDLPGSQFDLLQDAVYFADGKPLILLLFNAGPLDITWAIANPGVTAILECFYPAQSTGEALRRVVTMTGSDPPPMAPAGRLTATWPAYLNQVGPITDYTMKGRTYRYYEGSPMFPFGYGLSYSTFIYSSLVLNSRKVKAGEAVSLTATVKNRGPYDADEVVQVYISWGNPDVPAPKLQLVAFQRVTLKNGESRSLQFTIHSHQMAVWLDEKVGEVVSRGNMKLYVGGQQPSQRVRVPSNILEDYFIIV